MESAHVLVIGDSAWICTGKRGEHNKRTPAQIDTVYLSEKDNAPVRLIRSPLLKLDQIVSIEDGSRKGQPTRTVIELPWSKRIGVLIEPRC